MPGLRKNLKVSNPSMGASLKAPPTAETQLAVVPTPAMTQSEPDHGVRWTLSTPQTRRPTTASSAPAAPHRTARLSTTRPRTWNCMGMVYFDWSSSRRKVL